MKFGFLGFAHGHAAGYAARIDHELDLELAAIFDADLERLASAVSQYGGAAYSDSAELLERSEIDAVIVMAETSLHAELVVAAAEAGKHVLCEKPIATSRADAVRMVEACRQYGVTFGTIFPMRYNAALTSAKASIQSGAIGNPAAVSGTNNGQMPPGWFQDPVLAGGGAVMDHVVHLADLYRWMFLTEIVEVFAEIDTRFTPGLAVDDVGLLMLRFANGMTASIDCSWNRPPEWPTWGGLTVEVVGSGGVISVDAFSEQTRLASSQTGRLTYVPWGDDPDLQLLRGFVAAVREGDPPPISGFDGLRALDVALCAYESAHRSAPVSCHLLDGAR
jgi:predicted dehydrogenase